jgi:phosphotriesterase-related protein
MSHYLINKVVPWSENMSLSNYIMTVTGKIQNTNPGHCQVHEHVFVADNPAVSKNPALLIDEIDKSEAELIRYYKAGGRMIGDAQPLGAGRSITSLERLSLATNVKIVASTGFHMPMFYPADHYIFTTEEDRLKELFLKELTEGCYADGAIEWPVQQTEIKAGMVKAAIGNESITGAVRVRLAAAGAAAAAAGVPLMLHTDQGLHAIEAIKLLEEKGLAPDRILLCHADRQTDDFAIHFEIARTGVWLEFDTIGRFRYHDDESEIRLVKTLLDNGHINRLLLSMDPTRERLKTYGGSVGMDYIIETFIPALISAGVGKAEIRQITVDNPATALSVIQ